MGARMSAIFGMFTQFLHAYITIYRNLTPNITKGQKRVKKGPKMIKKIVKFKNAHRNTIYEFNFMHFYTIYIYSHMTIYRNLTPNITKGQKRVQKGKKMLKIKNAHRNTIYECNFWDVYTIYICA